MQLETKRHLFHVIAGMILAALYAQNILTTLRLFLLLCASTALFAIYARAPFPILRFFMRNLERQKNTALPGIGVVFFLLGIILASALYPHALATASIFILASADGFAALIGPYGRHPYFNRKKTWEGILAGIIAGTFFAQFFVPLLPAFTATTITMLIEGLDLRAFGRKIDDNLIIPLLSGAILSLF